MNTMEKRLRREQERRARMSKRIAAVWLATDPHTPIAAVDAMIEAARAVRRKVQQRQRRESEARQKE